MIQVIKEKGGLVYDTVKKNSLIVYGLKEKEIQRRLPEKIKKGRWREKL